MQKLYKFTRVPVINVGFRYRYKGSTSGIKSGIGIEIDIGIDTVLLGVSIRINIEVDIILRGIGAQQETPVLRAALAREGEECQRSLAPRSGRRTPSQPIDDDRPVHGVHSVVARLTSTFLRAARALESCTGLSLD